jgi:hypothetical protein
MTRKRAVKYRCKTDGVEAMQYLGAYDDGKLSDFLGKRQCSCGWDVTSDSYKAVISPSCKPLDLRRGEYLLRDADGGLSVASEDVFRMLFEPAGEGD